MANWGNYPGQGGPDAYDTLRNRAAIKSDAQSSDNMQALQRRYAAIGGLNSGAGIQAQQVADRNAAQDKAQTQSGIDLSQTQESNERNFANDQANNQKTFQGQQAQMGRDLEREKIAQQGSQFQQELPMKQRQMELEERAQSINASMNAWSQKHSGGLLGAGGFLGTGIGA